MHYGAEVKSTDAPKRYDQATSKNVPLPRYGAIQSRSTLTPDRRVPNCRLKIKVPDCRENGARIGHTPSPVMPTQWTGFGGVRGTTPIARRWWTPTQVARDQKLQSSDSPKCPWGVRPVRTTPFSDRHEHASAAPAGDLGQSCLPARRAREAHQSRPYCRSFTRKLSRPPGTSPTLPGAEPHVAAV